MPMKQFKFTLGFTVVLMGLIYLFVSGFQQSRATHMTVSTLVEKGGHEDLGQQRIRLGGQVVEGSIQWDRYRHRPIFAVTEGDCRLQVRYTGTALLPDTFKEGSPVILEGHYVKAKDVFEAEVVFAKCPSKYEGQSYEGHVTAGPGI